MSRLDRRTFIKGTSLAVAAAGTLSALPAVAPALIGSVADELAPPAGEAAGDMEPIAGPLVARVVDAVTGEVEVFFGETGVTTKNPELVRQLLRAARG